MKQKLVALLLSTLLVLSFSTGLSEQAQVHFTDMVAREITLAAPATRIVALSPSDCEILYAIGAGDTLVGRGAYCDYPEAILDVPVVQSGAETNLEEILALEPQVVVMGMMAQTEEQSRALENAGVVVVTSNAQDVQGVYTAITMLGELAGKNTEAAALVNQMQSEFDAVKSLAAASPLAAPRTVYFEVSPLAWGLWTAGRNTFMDELATMCGLENAFADVEGWAEISAEQVLERDPDYIVTITMDDTDGLAPVEEIKLRDGWQTLKAVVENHVLQADNDQITRPGPRLTEAIQFLYHSVYGEE